MSITDDSTGLDTAWTEQPVVAFTAGTLGTMSTCIDYVSRRLQRGTLSATSTPTLSDVQTDIIRAKEELCETMGFTWQRRYAYADTVANQYRYALPPDYMGGQIRVRDTTSNYMLNQLDTLRYNLLYPDPSEEDGDEPSGFVIKDRELWLIPPPNGVYRIELEYDRSGTDNTATDISYVPEPLRFKLCDYAVYQSFLILNEYDKAQLFKGEWMGGLAKAKRADSHKKWAGMGYQAMSTFQVYNNRPRQRTIV
jgi:hypothetical protein